MQFRGSTGISVIVIGAALLFAILLGSVASSYDFRAFYCAAGIAYHHGNPYNDEPLHSCERLLPANSLGSFSKTTTLPAPLPGYAIGMFIPLSLLPFEMAAHVWTFLLYAAIAVCVFCTARLTGLTIATTTAAFLLSLCAASVGLGETVPICVAAICLAALLAQERKWLGASIAAIATLIEPHIGLPIILCMAIWWPLSRKPLIIAALVLAAISLVTLGPAANVEYFAQVLPAHALSEIGSDAQMSLSVIIYGAGVTPNLAVAIGTVSFLLAAVCGIIVGGILARKCGSNAFLVVTPAAMSLVGGAFIHVTQMAAALPLAMLLMVRAPRYRLIFLMATLLLAIPWRIVGSPLLITVAVTVILFLAWGNGERRLSFALGVSTVGLLLILAVNYWMVAAPSGANISSSARVRINPKYAEASWARYNESYLSSGAAETWWRRVPTWMGLLLLSGATANLATTKAASRRLRMAME